MAESNTEQARKQSAVEFLKLATTGEIEALYFGF